MPWDKPNDKQALEGADVELCARLYAIQADAWIGMAGHDVGQEGRNRSTIVNKAEMYLDRARERKLNEEALGHEQV
jgi:hypothetical protein